MQPTINPLLAVGQSKEQYAVVSFLGAQLKAVEGIGDRSAYGLPDEKGVVVIDAGRNSVFTQSGLMNKDVMRTVNGKIISSLQDFMALYTAAKKGSTLSMELIRDQKLLKKELIIK